MSDHPDILERLAAEKARLLEEANAVDRKMADIERIAALAAEYNLVLAPAVTAQPTGTHLKTISDLIQVYKTAARSPYQKLRHATKGHYNALLGMIENDFGKEHLTSLQLHDFKRWHERWGGGGKVAIAYAKIGMLRALFGFGTEIIQNDECQRLFGILCKLKVKAPKVRTERLTAIQAEAIRRKAHLMKRPSVALAQAFQSDLNLLQKDVVGEWVPVAAPGVSEITAGSLKWVRGLRWNEIDENFILRHSSDSWQGNIEHDLRKAPAVLDELRTRFGFNIDKSSRDTLPKSGPVVVSEHDGLPWTGPEFRRWWRILADACGVPKSVRNSDSRARAKESAQAIEEPEGEKVAR